MYKLHEKSPQSGTERFKRVFTRGLNRFVPFRSILRLTFQSRPLFGTERNVSSRSRVNTCKNSFVFWNSSTSFRSVPFSCERGPSLAKGVLFGNFSRVRSRQGYAFWEFWSKRCQNSVIFVKKTQPLKNFGLENAKIWQVLPRKCQFRALLKEKLV